MEWSDWAELWAMAGEGAADEDGHEAVRHWPGRWIRRRLGEVELGGALVVDLGSGGASALSVWLAGRARHVVRVDLHQPPDKLAGSTGIVADLERALPLRGEFADVVVCNMVLQHLRPAAREGLMGEVARVLRPGGVALMTCHHLFGLDAPALEVLRRETWTERWGCGVHEQVDLAGLLEGAPAAGLRARVSEVDERFPGHPTFADEARAVEGGVLLAPLADLRAGPWSESAQSLGLRRGVWGVVLEKIGATVRVFPEAPRGETDGSEVLERFTRQWPTLLGARLMLVGEASAELAGPLREAGAGVVTLVADGTESAGRMRARWPGFPVEERDFDGVWEVDESERHGVAVAVHELERSANPDKMLRNLASAASQVWLAGSFVDSEREECAYIHADDPVDGGRFGGRNRISLGWAYRQLQHYGCEPMSMEPLSLRRPERARYCVAARRLRPPEPLQPLLVHVHLPKNAGSSLNDALMRTSGTRFVPLYHTDPRRVYAWHDMVEAALAHPEALVISSHSFRVFPAVLGCRRALHVTFLRRPLSRALSYYRYGRKTWAGMDESHRATLPKGFMEMSPCDYLRFEADLHRRGILPSTQTAMLAGGEESAARATETLSNFFFVGLVEQMERSMRLLGRKLERAGLSLPGWEESVPWVNQTRRGESEAMEEASAELAKASRYLAEDEALYEWAARRFEEEAREWGI